MGIIIAPQRRQYAPHPARLAKYLLKQTQIDTSLNNLGALLDSLGDLTGARPYHEHALAIYEEVLGPQHPRTAQSLNNLGVLCYYESHLREAARLMQRAWGIHEAVLGPDHPDTQSSRQSLSAIQAQLQETDKE
jgi:Flp pilus assembly protein TadD